MKFKELFKKSITYPLLYVVVSIVWQLIFHQNIDWYKSIGVGIFVFLFNFLYEWSKIPFKWRKRNDS